MQVSRSNYLPQASRSSSLCSQPALRARVNGSTAVNRLVARVASGLSSGGGPAAPMQPAPTQTPRLQLLSSVSKLVEVQAMTRKYELLAGRSAMLGTSTAIICELLTQESFIQAQNAPTPLMFTEMALASVTVAALCAAFSSFQMRPRLLEPVITSLTAVRRSGSSISASNASVDRAVDEVVRSAFTAERLRELTDFTAEV